MRLCKRNSRDPTDRAITSLSSCQQGTTFRLREQKPRHARASQPAFPSPIVERRKMIDLVLLLPPETSSQWRLAEHSVNAELK